MIPIGIAVPMRIDDETGINVPRVIGVELSYNLLIQVRECVHVCGSSPVSALVDSFHERSLVNGSQIAIQWRWACKASGFVHVV